MCVDNDIALHFEERSGCEANIEYYSLTIYQGEQPGDGNVTNILHKKPTVLDRSTLEVTDA